MKCNLSLTVHWKPGKRHLILLLLLVNVLFSSDHTSSSSGITVHLKNASLKSVFHAIEKQSAYDFMYKPQVIKQARSVTVDITNATLEEALLICFKEQPFSYVITKDLKIIVQLKRARPVRHRVYNIQAHLRFCNGQYWQEKFSRPGFNTPEKFGNLNNFSFVYGSIPTA